VAVSVAAAPAERPRSDRLDIAAAILLALAALATAWSSYQASRWNGEQATTASRANASRTNAARAAESAANQTQIDVATFIQWIDATGRGDGPLAQFYEQRFRPEFRPAFDAWLAQHPLTNPQAPSTPFATPEYQLAAAADARRLDAQTDVLAAAVPRNVQRATNYVLGVVLFAVALFFAGMSSKVHGRTARATLLAAGAIVFVGAAVWIATLPVTISV
jgi:TRAP-type C4-dicarboxylate transport system permease small subunit